ncbi:DNA primase/polymerase [Gordonia phage Sixama]|uniref:DNA primase/polymerase n=1 Tax=Gordonia phage Sixama TaxID=2653271 RepID=A0A5Q2F5G8_9CAUD|nr:DNA primase/polymerase [Gordonia phage Sixama]QGF20344.1 DNA primase/polymerase [Gordonia phage Sixama]
MTAAATPASEPAPQRREDRVPGALAYYTDVLKLTVTPIHVPVWIQEGEGASASGECSCGDPYTLDQYGFVDKSQPNTCTSPGKHPVKLGFASNPDCQATTSADATTLWREAAGSQWPIAVYNVGVVTGKGTGLVVIDVDVRSQGLESMALLEHALSELGVTWRLTNTFSYFTSGAASGRGYHLYFKTDRDDDQLWRSLRLLGENILPGVELKWKRGMVVAAPSLHASGAVYELQNTTEVAELNQERLDDLTRAVAVAKGAPVQSTGTLNAPRSVADLFHSAGGATAMRTWHEAAEDAALTVNSNSGRWVREVEYLFMSGSPIRTYGPGEHEQSLRPMFAAAVNLFPPHEDIEQDILDNLDANRSWLPPIYAMIFQAIDEAVTKPLPWSQQGHQGSDLENFIGLGRYALREEIQKRRRQLSR